VLAVLRIAYLLLTLALFGVELYIALYVHDGFIRPFLGDTLVVLLIYLFCQIFLLKPARPVALGVLLFAFIVEFFQAVDIVAVLGWQNIEWLSIVIGRSFSWADLVAYTVGAVLTLGDPLAPRSSRSV
jgi:hypothetical protein